MRIPRKGVDPSKQALNTIDAGPPTSSVGPLPPEETSTSFTVTWSGQDDPGGSGIAFYNIYVSDDGGPFTLWQSDTTATSATYSGVAGQTYGFYSVATDNVGNVQATPTSAQATTLVMTQPSLQPTNLSAVAGSGTYAGTASLTATLTAGGAPLAGEIVAFTLTSGTTVTPVGSATTDANGVATLLGVSLAGFSSGTFTGAVGAGFAGDATDATSSAGGDLTVSPAQATLSLGGLVFTYDGTPQAATVATSPAGLSGVTVTYTQNNVAVAAPTTAGSYTVVAALDNPNYTANSVTGTLVINPATPTITWANPANITYGTALGATQLDATASVPGTFVYTPVAGTVLSAGQGQVLVAMFTPTDTTDYSTVTTTATINVGKATPTLTWANPANITYGTSLGATQLDATASVPGAFAYTPAAGTVRAPDRGKSCR